MIQKETKEESIRREFFKMLNLVKPNRQIAELYMDMERPEDLSLLQGIIHQDLSGKSKWISPKEDYPEFLRKKKMTQELARCVRLLTAVGGSTAYGPILSFDSYAEADKLRQMLSYLTGEQAKEQSIAVQAGFHTRGFLWMRPEEIKEFCRSGAEDPEIFLRAREYCFDCTQFGRVSHSRMLLTATYLHFVPPQTAPELVQELEERMIDSFLDLSAFKKPELAALESYARSAGKDTPFPRQILSIYSKRRLGLNMEFLGGCAFLALEHSLRFEIIFRMAVAAKYRHSISSESNTLLKLCRDITDEDWFDRHMKEMEDMLPIEDEFYILECMELGYQKAVERMAVKCPESIQKAAEKANAKKYRELMEIVQNAAPKLYAEMKESFWKIYSEKLASEMVSRVYPGREASRMYLLGTESVEALKPHIKEWRNDYYEEKENYIRLQDLKRLDLPMYRRGIVLQALRKMAGFFTRYPIYESEEERTDDKELMFEYRQLEAILQILEEENIPLGFQIEALGGMGEAFGSKKKKASYLELCVQVFRDRKKGQDMEQWEKTMAKTVLDGSPEACCLCLKVLKQYKDEAYKDIYLSCAANSSKQVRALLLDICREHREWEPDILKLLEAKKVKEREFAVMLLEEWGAVSCLPKLQEALGREKNKKLAEQMQDFIEELQGALAGADGQGRSQNANERLAAEIFRGNRKRKVEWVQSLSLPEVHRKDGSPVSAEYMFALLALYADMEDPGIPKDAKKLAEPLDAESLADYMQKLYEGWMSAGAEAKKRWVLYAVSVHGGSRMVPVLHSQIKIWAENQRGAIAAETVQALALNDSPQALLLVDHMSRKFKFRQIKNAAGAALQNTASLLGISREELEDRLVPDLGFDSKMEQMFDYGSRKFTVRLNQALEMEIYDGNGKRLKNMPAPGKQDDPEKAASSNQAFKQMKKQLKETITSQKLRLEQALSVARFWEADRWKALFVQNPVMHLFAEGLIWGIYEGQECRGAFRYMEDGTFNTVEEEEFVLPETGKIGLVHPLELTAEDLKAWKEQLADYEIVQPFDQLGRPVCKATKEEQESLPVSRFADATLNGLTLSGRLLGMGWFRGEILDAGFFENYYRNDGAFGAELVFSGSSVGYEYDEVTIKELYFYRLSPEDAKSSAHRAFENGSRCLPGEVPGRYFSEVLLQVAKAVGEQVQNLD